jgi:hypothetical protein
MNNWAWGRKDRKDVRQGKARERDGKVRYGKAILNIPWAGSSHIKKQKEFRKIFDFSEDEEIVASYSCSMRAGGMIENMVQGTMFITNKYVCFYSNFWGTEKKEAFLFQDIIAIEKKNTARIIPNAIEITVQTEHGEEKYFFLGHSLIGMKHIKLFKIYGRRKNSTQSRWKCRA